VSDRTILFSIPLTLSLIGLGGCAGLMDEPSARNGGGYIVPPAPIPQEQPSVIDGYGNPAPELQSPMPMLDNPDAKKETWEDQEFADSQEEAESKCRSRAERLTASGSSVIRSTGAKHVSGKLFMCQFESEVPNEEDN
jgi:hypothetical protein